MFTNKCVCTTAKVVVSVYVCCVASHLLNSNPSLKLKSNPLNKKNKVKEIGNKLIVSRYLSNKASMGGSCG
jgi:hypothetical protein